jgi:hypothetical protein
MQILARIPVLQVADEPVVAVAGEHVVAVAEPPVVVREVPVVESPAAVRERDEEPAVAERGRRARLPAPSILVLGILAVAVWGAALRNDRLRLAAARQARAERLAQVVPDAVVPRESRTR